MILGKIIGRFTTLSFDFLVEGNAKKFQYCQVNHKDYGYVLCQIVELVRDNEKTIAKCNVIGYRDKIDKRIKQIRNPFEPGTEVLAADDEFIKGIIKLEYGTRNAYIGKLETREIKVYLDLQRVLTKHIAVLAKSGFGKSYTVGVLIEEILRNKVPLLIIDPHGEYSTLKYPDEGSERHELYGISVKGFMNEVQEYGDISINQSLRPLKLNENLSADEIMHILPAKLSNVQQSLLYSTLRDIEEPNLDELTIELQTIDNGMKWGLISAIDYLRKLNLFSSRYTDYNELIVPGRCSIINVKGIEPEVQQIIVYKLMKDLFEARKKGKIPPFFAVIEEAHNFLPERSFGEAKSSRIMRTIASEGRKFGMGLCVVSQRPARCDKSVLSQCSTQVILKVTNPQDLRAISSSVENITSETEKEIQNLAIGTAMITGIVDLPLFVNIRPRMSKHGGEAVDVFGDNDETEDYEEDDNDEGTIITTATTKEDNIRERDSKVETYATEHIKADIEHSEIRKYSKDEKEEITNYENLLCVIKPKLSIKDLELMSEKKIKGIKTYLIPAVIFFCYRGDEEFNMLVELFKGTIVRDTSEKSTINIPKTHNLSIAEGVIITEFMQNERLSAADIVGKTNIGLIKLQQIMDNMSKKGVLVKKDRCFELDKDYKVLGRINEYNFLGRTEYSNVKFDIKLRKNLDINEIRKELERFISIKDEKECYIIHHQVIFEDADLG
ncbi:ATP-binding protein [Candidatus Woesearchaeota archaeon]|nr:ATP-binding protein [Candidatus Woesearchaeota archaeon]